MIVRLAAGLLALVTLLAAGCCCARDCARPVVANRPCCPTTSFAAPPLRSAPVVVGAPVTNGCCN